MSGKSITLGEAREKAIIHMNNMEKQRMEAASPSPDDADLDQPATLGWIRSREAWEDDVDEHDLIHSSGKIAVREWSDGVWMYSGAALNETMQSVTRKQVIAAEQFAREMGWT